MKQQLSIFALKAIFGGLISVMLVFGLSPDAIAQAQKFAFHTERDGDNEIYSMNADGSGLRRLTTGGGISSDW